MSITQWILVVWIGLSGLAVFVRGIVGSTRTYTGADAFFGAIECIVMAVLVTRL